MSDQAAPSAGGREPKPEFDRRLCPVWGEQRTVAQSSMTWTISSTLAAMRGFAATGDEVMAVFRTLHGAARGNRPHSDPLTVGDVELMLRGTALWVLEQLGEPAAKDNTKGGA